MNCLEGTLWSPRERTVLGISLDHKGHFWRQIITAPARTQRSLCLHLEPGEHWSACFWQGSQSLPEFPVQQLRTGPTALQEGKTATWHSSRSHFSTRGCCHTGNICLIRYILLLHERPVNWQKDRIHTCQLIVNQGFSIFFTQLFLAPSLRNRKSCFSNFNVY